MTERFSASVAGRHMACPASANLELAIPGWQRPPRVVGGAADEGTKRHEYLEPILSLSTKDILGFARILQYVGEIASTRRFKRLVEEKIKATWLVQQPETTVDYVLYTQDEMHVFDWKWGKIPVPVTGNAQLLFYAVSVAALAPRAKGVNLHICQPYADNFDSVFVDTNELMKFRNEALEAERRIMAKDLTFGPTDKECTFCPANPHGRGAKAGPYCPPLMQVFYPPVIDEDDILALD